MSTPDMKEMKGAPPNFTVAFLVPLFLYFFAAFKLKQMPPWQ